ncbi:hydroxyisourate hydrolase [Paenibacillus harenae]|uniref:hydroxyisourate hydrolase n=1 Tax=Paenibacillus harenae TaxID=306543 RepID=UPI0004125F66|nr:hydroxyisourate hydrolase [Paenibacillus harenae]
MNGRVTTHVLDLTAGGPAVGITIALWYFGELASPQTKPVKLGIFKTNGDGRVDRPLLEGEAVQPGIYELVFATGDYFRSGKNLPDLTDCLFEEIPIRFRIRDSQSHYHVPLLVAPGGYSTYRGT